MGRVGPGKWSQLKLSSSWAEAEADADAGAKAKAKVEPATRKRKQERTTMQINRQRNGRETQKNNTHTQEQQIIKEKKKPKRNERREMKTWKKTHNFPQHLASGWAKHRGGAEGNVGEGHGPWKCKQWNALELHRSWEAEAELLTYPKWTLF